MTAAIDGASELLISLPDVARLAAVQRPVVSMWRKRSAPSSRPFPASVPVGGAQEMFDGAAVVEWLEATGRGNNRDPRADLAAFAAPRDAPLHEPTVFAGVTALLALAAAHGPLPTDPNELLDLADADDPDDEYLYSELAVLGDRLIPLVRFVTDLIDAAYSPASAFEKLMIQRFRLSIPGHAQIDTAPQVRELVMATALALGTQAELRQAVIVDPTAGGTDLVVDLVRRAAEVGSVAIATPDRQTAAARLGRRRFRAHDLTRIRLAEDGQGGFVFPSPAVVVVQLPSVDEPTMSDTAALRFLNEITVCCTGGQRVVVVGPSSAFTDRATGDEVTGLRRDLLRTGLVRAVVRLPYGLLTTQGRRRLALWCLGPAPAPSAGGARTLVADLANHILDAATIDGLVADLVAAMEGSYGRAHTPQVSRSEPTSALQLSQGDLVTPTAPLRQQAVPVETVDRLVQLTDAMRTSLPGWTAPTGAVRFSAARRTVTTVADAMSRQELHVLPGTRIETKDLVVSHSGLTVLGPAQVLGQRASLSQTIDPLLLAARYPTSRLTEPGDVVFCTAPRPAARVDREGGSVVVFPAKVLRCRDGRLVPAVVAADINAQPETAKNWRAWALRHVAEDQTAALATTLDDIAQHRQALADRLDTLDELTALLIDAAASGSLDLNLRKEPDHAASP